MTHSHTIRSIRTSTLAAAGLALSMLTLGSLSLDAQELPTPRVDAEWLSDALSAPDLVVLHVGGDEEAFAESHIPGARYFNLGDVVYSRGSGADPDRIAVDLPQDLEDVREALQSAGVSDDSRVVVYIAGDRPAYLGTRLLWTLEFMGLGDRSALLDGGLQAWEASGRPLESGAPDEAPVPGRLTTGPVASLLVDRDWMTSNLETEGVAILDARMPQSYTGEREELPGRAGHIPGAGSLPTEELFDAEGLLRPTSELRDLFARAGVDDGDTVVAYCHVGLRASVVIYAARAAGFNAVLYDGSMAEWARDDSLPLVSGNDPR